MAGSGQAGGAARVEVFAYPGPAEDAGWAAAEGWLGADPAEKRAREPQEPKHPAAEEAELRAEFDRRLSEEARRSFEAGRERGRLEGQKSEMEAQATARAEADQRRVRQAMELVESFAAERDRYLRTVEREVVELALAIAARILRREAQMDPLLLTGAVRVALGQLTGATEVRLRVPAGELDLWTESMALVPNLAVKPMVVAGEGMRVGECLIETELGTVDLGIRPQLSEIERGFFDRAGVPGKPAPRLERAAAAGAEKSV